MAGSEQRTVLTVICFLGTAALLLIGGTIYLVHEVITLDKITPASVAVLTAVSGLAGTALGSLGTMLASTKSSPAAGDPTTFTAPPSSTVTVEPPDPVPAADRPARTKRRRTSS